MLWSLPVFYLIGLLNDSGREHSLCMVLSEYFCADWCSGVFCELFLLFYEHHLLNLIGTFTLQIIRNIFRLLSPSLINKMKENSQNNEKNKAVYHLHHHQSRGLHLHLKFLCGLPHHCRFQSPLVMFFHCHLSSISKSFAVGAFSPCGVIPALLALSH